MLNNEAKRYRTCTEMQNALAQPISEQIIIELDSYNFLRDGYLLRTTINL